MKLTIIRDEWLRGEGEDDSYLLRTEDRMKCCLGFLALACGAEVERISGVQAPDAKDGISWPKGLLKEDAISAALSGSILSKLIEANDDMDLHDDVREEEIKRLMSKIEVEVEFV